MKNLNDIIDDLSSYIKEKVIEKDYEVHSIGKHTITIAIEGMRIDLWIRGGQDFFDVFPRFHSNDNSSLEKAIETELKFDTDEQRRRAWNNLYPEIQRLKHEQAQKEVEELKERIEELKEYKV